MPFKVDCLPTDRQEAAHPRLRLRNIFWKTKEDALEMLVRPHHYNIKKRRLSDGSWMQDECKIKFQLTRTARPGMEAFYLNTADDQTADLVWEQLLNLGFKTQREQKQAATRARRKRDGDRRDRLEEHGR